MYRALYFPRIEVEDPGWLLGAVLFWDEIHTITPDLVQPYQSPLAVELNAEGALLPYRISPDSEATADVIDGVMDLLTSPELPALMRGGGSWIMSRLDRHEFVSRDKIHSNLQHAIRELFGPEVEQGPNLKLPTGLAAAYMLSLATEVAANDEMDLVTDCPAEFRAAETILRPVTTSAGHYPWDIIGPRQWRDRQAMHQEFASSCLSEAAVNWMRIDPDTPVKKVIRFRERRHDELQHLRDLLRDAARSVLRQEDPLSRAELQKRASSYVEEELRPALETAQRTLREAKVNFIPETIESVVTSELPAAAAAMMGATWALVAAPIFALSIRGVRHLVKVKDARKQCPYQYLLRSQETFGS